MLVVSSDPSLGAMCGTRDDPNGRAERGARSRCSGRGAERGAAGAGAGGCWRFRVIREHLELEGEVFFFKKILIAAIPRTES